MTSNILNKIIAAKRRRLVAGERDDDLADLPRKTAPNRLFRALSDAAGPGIIAEFKRASPSRGVINVSGDPARTAEVYKSGGAAAISVLTEEDFFHGSLEDLQAVRRSVDLPILRKDFVIDEFQLRESAAAGADAILLIVAALSVPDLERFLLLSDTLGLDAVVEVHNLEELSVAADMGARLIGVNNRDLKTFEVSLEVSRTLIQHAPAGAVMIAESGIRSREDIQELSALGYAGFLVGESLMTAGDAAKTLEEWV